MLFLMTMLTICFAVHSDYSIIKTCLSVCGETTIYSTATGDVLLGPEFNYLFFGILHVQNINDRRLRNPTPQV